MGDVLGTIIGALVAGIIIGPLARLVMPGKQNLSMGITILVGAVGALVGGFIYQALGGDETGGIDWIKLAVQVGVAALAIVLYANMGSNKTAT
ncbi:MAG TPA: GlsB/YeaQ/YmgE family stress response membrane protein [Acidimicrobiia bacterium]